VEELEQLRAVEREAIARFKARQAEIQRANPELSAEVAFSRAVQSLPKTADKYEYARMRLTMAGIMALPLH
jgi:hypothetical protein